MSNPATAQLTLALSIDPAALPGGDYAELLAALEDFSPVIAQFTAIQREYDIENFESRGDTFDQPWQPNAPSTERERERLGYGGSPQLVRTGLLFSALGEYASDTSSASTVGVDLSAFPVPYPSYLQSGTGTMPGRVLVGVNNPDEQQLLEDALKAYLEQKGFPADSITIELTADAA